MIGCKEYFFEKDSSFLVTGGAGFIGSNLVEKILNLGYKVRVLDNFSTGKKRNIEEFLDDSNFELMEGDIRDLVSCQQACEDVDYILHQAALCSIPRSIKNPRATNDVNIIGTLNMLIAARDNKVKRFVYASSSSVYGDEPNLPKVEDRVGKPLSPYAITKKVNELYARNFYELYELPVIGLRYFNVFGKKQDCDSVYAAVIPIFIKKLLDKKAPTINGDGKQSRDFTYIENAVEANLKACLSDERALGEVFNVAYGGRVYLNDLYWKICELLNINTQPAYGPERPGDIKHSNADISKAKKILEYHPEYDVDKGLENVIKWYRENL